MHVDAARRCCRSAPSWSRARWKTAGIQDGDPRSPRSRRLSSADPCEPLSRAQQGFALRKHLCDRLAILRDQRRWLTTDRIQLRADHEGVVDERLGVWIFLDVISIVRMGDAPGIATAVPFAYLKNRVCGQRCPQPRDRVHALCDERLLNQIAKGCASERHVELIRLQTNSVFVVDRLAI